MERWKQFKAEMPRKYEQSRHFALESAAYECGCTRADLEAALTSQDPDYMAEERRVFADAFDKRMRDCGYSL